jgi:hypothetical protein
MFADDIGVAASTVKDWRWVDSRWPATKRNDGVAFSMHRILASIADEELRWAAINDPPFNQRTGQHRWVTAPVHPRRPPERRANSWSDLPPDFNGRRSFDRVICCLHACRCRPSAVAEVPSSGPPHTLPRCLYCSVAPGPALSRPPVEADQRRLRHRALPPAATCPVGSGRGGSAR